FFFSRRRRHTRSKRDWSSDVCSSDLVIQADGGTRTASITGAFVATVLAFGRAIEAGTTKKMPVKDFLAATSVGMLDDGEIVLDLDYHEDSAAQVDMNVVMTGNGEFVEIQGTGEEATFSRTELNTLLENAEIGIEKIFEIQKESLGSLVDKLGETVKNK